MRRRVNSAEKKNNIERKTNGWKIELIERGKKEMSEEKLLYFLFSERTNEFVAPYTQHHSQNTAATNSIYIFCITLILLPFDRDVERANAIPFNWVYVIIKIKINFVFFFNVVFLSWEQKQLIFMNSIIVLTTTTRKNWICSIKKANPFRCNGKFTWTNFGRNCAKSIKYHPVAEWRTARKNRWKWKFSIYKRWKSRGQMLRFT